MYWFQRHSVKVVFYRVFLSGSSSLDRIIHTNFKLLIIFEKTTLFLFLSRLISQHLLSPSFIKITLSLYHFRSGDRDLIVWSFRCILPGWWNNGSICQFSSILGCHVFSFYSMTFDRSTINAISVHVLSFLLWNFYYKINFSQELLKTTKKRLKIDIYKFYDNLIGY